jgi:LysM repeat protein
MKITRYTKLILLSFTFLTALSAYGKSDQEKYISQYAELAVKEMYRSGVPASITLAQGLLESGNGKSTLAVKGNNHFGIKCHKGWTGKSMRHDDDKKNECFRVYDSPEESFRDHSDFLRYRDRYSFLFDFRITDYKSWAHGLKKAGYATDPSYPQKLIRIIEEYDLHKYDRKSSRKHSEESSDEVIQQELPKSPSQIEQDVPLEENMREQFSFSLSRPVYTRNRVPFVYAEEGDTYEILASLYGLFPREILKFNDVKDPSDLKPGDVVYLRTKKNRSAKGLDKHVMEEGETLAEISQRYAVKLSRIYKLNGFDQSYVPSEGEIIKLRKR